MGALTGLALLGGGLGLAAARQDRKSAEKSVESAERQRDESQAFIEKSIAQGRADQFKLFPSAQQSLQTGLGAGLDVLRQSIPGQFQAFQGGNVAAQNQLIQGLPQQINALLGKEVDFNPQATQLGLPNAGAIPNLPQFGSINDLGLGGGPGGGGGIPLGGSPAQNLDPQMIQELIAEFQASQGGG